MSSKKDSTFQTFLVAFLTCAVCGVFVSTAAVMLRPLQVENQELFKNKNILLACGLLERGEKISAQKCREILDKEVRVLKVDFATGKIVAEGAEALKYDERLAAKTPGQNVSISGPYKLGLTSRGRFGTVYATKDRVVLPIVGKGLWSVMSGFIALDSESLNTVECLLFYDHAETAGLGGEIENPRWQNAWVGKSAFEGNTPKIHVIKGVAPKDSPFEVDGISGSTLTCNGVNATVGYWLSQYRPFLTKYAENKGENVQ
ncbi:MAG: NADH:ubiquinone reductase (Na(+)-transporting) subunit C [Planctomycetia bacterium]|nr:NADH:ubiquinone reductase (Na(+)-transporting) subunit C [Planctomycetia bacterium]